MKRASILTDSRGGPRQPYQWPASRLTDDEMWALYRERERTGLQVNELLRRAILATYSPEGSTTCHTTR